MKSSTQVKTTWRMCLEMENNGRVIWTFCINVLPPAKKKKKKELALSFLWQWKIALRIWKLLLFPWIFILSMLAWKAFWKVYSTLNTYCDWDKNPIQACLSPKPVLFPLFHIITINVILMASRACFPSSY